MEKTGSRYRIVVAVLVLLSNLALGLNLFSATPLLPLIIEDYSINRATAGLLITLPLLFAAIFGLPGGVIISRLGLRRAFTLGWSLISLMALSGVVPNFGTLLALRIAYGIGLAIIVTATGPLLMRWFRPKEILMKRVQLGCPKLGHRPVRINSGPFGRCAGLEKRAHRIFND